MSRARAKARLGEGEGVATTAGGGVFALLPQRRRRSRLRCFQCGVQFQVHWKLTLPRESQTGSEVWSRRTCLACSLFSQGTCALDGRVTGSQDRSELTTKG